MKRNHKMMITATTAAIMLITALLGYMRVLYPLDMSASDALCQKASVTNKNIYMIAIDDKTLNEYGPVSSWSRNIPAKLVECLNADENARPAVIGFDVIYSENVEETADNHFAQVCKDGGNVVTAMSFQFKEEPETDENGNTIYNPHYIDRAVLPFDALMQQSDYGFATTVIDDDGYVRRALTSVDYDGNTVYSFAAKVYLNYQKSQGLKASLPKTDAYNQYYFSYSGKSGCYSTVSMADILDGTVDVKMFQNAIVLVGAYAVGMQDAFTPAISHGQQMYGVEVHANIVEALLEGHTQTDFPVLIYAIAAGMVAGIFFLLIRKMKIVPATVLFAVLTVADIAFAKVMYEVGYIVPVVLIPLILFLLYIANLVHGYITEILRRKRVVDVFKQYVAPQVVDKISKDKDFELFLGGENRHVAVLFVDIRGFTTMSESLEPEEVVEILNEYLALTTKSIFDNGGTLDKFVGDATMAVFNAPFDLDDYIYRAVCTARDMKNGADAIADKFEKRFGKSVAFGIGVNCGNAVVGNIGCDFRMDYTAIGDTVNTAARLESNAKRGQILISQSVYEAVKDRVSVTPIGEISLKGKSQGVFVYQLDEVR